MIHGALTARLCRARIPSPTRPPFLCEWCFCWGNVTVTSGSVCPMMVIPPNPLRPPQTHASTRCTAKAALSNPPQLQADGRFICWTLLQLFKLRQEHVSPFYLKIIQLVSRFKKKKSYKSGSLMCLCKKRFIGCIS